MIQGAAGHEHLALLRNMGGNTIRVYDTLNLESILDSAYAHDLAVIVGLWMMGEKEMDYRDSFMVADQYEQIRQSVRRYKDHPALLMWCIGNEISYTAEFMELLYPPQHWLAFADLVDLVHQEDPNHPVTTTITNFQRMRLLYFKMYVPQLDLVGVNSFGRLSDLRDMADQTNWLLDMPYFLSEWAIQGPWECPTTEWYTPIEPGGNLKAEEYVRYYQEYIPHEDPRYLGSCIFYWGYKQEHTHTWYSLFTEDGRPTSALEALGQAWTGKMPENRIAVADSLLLNGKSTEDQIILRPGQMVDAHLFAYDPDGDRMLTHWELLPDHWHFDYRALNTKPDPIDGHFVISGNRDLRFTAPSEEGTYRLFAEVRDSGSGGSTIINTSFLVLR